MKVIYTCIDPTNRPEQYSFYLEDGKIMADTKKKTNLYIRCIWDSKDIAYDSKNNTERSITEYQWNLITNSRFFGIQYNADEGCVDVWL